MTLHTFCSSYSRSHSQHADARIPLCFKLKGGEQEDFSCYPLRFAFGQISNGLVKSRVQYVLCPTGQVWLEGIKNHPVRSSLSETMTIEGLNSCLLSVDA